ncbi:MAG: S8 family serine peptidase [Candidatus Promineifilaceae bacterium]
MRLPILLFILLFTGIGLFALTAVVPTDAQSSQEQTTKLADTLQRHLADANEGELVPILIEFSDKANIETRLPDEEVTRRTEIVSRLQATAAASQAGVMAQLTGRSAGEVRRLRSLWIVNQLAVDVSAELIPKLAADPQVSHISLDESLQLLEPAIAYEQKGHNSDYPEGAWGIDWIDAPETWNILGITGTGVVVAIMDTGVEWQHPILRDNYRGRDGDHSDSWFSAVYTNTTEPVDGNRHGTHVAGNAVGRGGLGVAPGAEWIGVQVLNDSGSGSVSGILEGFQWLLAPGGDAAKAPDIVNNSWGADIIGELLYDGFRVLQTAGIVQVFAAGNNGPFENSVGYPAGYPGAISIGAHDHTGQTAWFSSRGPSALTNERKPMIIAPGARILSSLPDDQYGLLAGTSMATPHVAGAMALLKSANPALSESDIAFILTSTVQTVNLTNVPNMADGWGQLDIYKAVASQQNVGQLTYLPQVGGTGLAVETVLVITQIESGQQLTKTIPPNGQLTLSLPTGYSYSVEASAFGMLPVTLSHTAQTAVKHLNFSRLPSHTISGRVRQANGNGIEATIEVLGTPLVTTSSADGQFTLIVPTGTYSLAIGAMGWAKQQALLNVVADSSPTYILSPAQSILLVDGAGWRYISEIDFYRQALTDLGVGFDEYPIMSPQLGAPTSAQLRQYDTVIWSDPYNSPGEISAGDVISDYLDAGGNLLLSGQNLASLDGGSLGVQLWWKGHLRGKFLGIGDPSGLTGTAHIPQFAGFTFELNGGDSADNQTQLEQAVPSTFSLATPLFETADGATAALANSICKPYKLVYFGFGLEGVRTGGTRTELLGHTLDYFSDQTAYTGLKFLHDPIDAFVLPGDQVSYTVAIANLDETASRTVELQSNSPWPTTITPSSVEIESCEAAVVTVSVTVPPNIAFGSQFSDILSAETNTHAATLSVQHKTPGNILFVDDDRWFNYEDRYQNELDRLGISYDYWNVGWELDDGRGSISAEYLNQYDIVIWYTGADWFQPLTPDEAENLHNYLNQGGRLFLTGQSILAHHTNSPFRKYLGVLEWQVDTPMSHLFGDSRGALPSEFGGNHTFQFDDYDQYNSGLVPSGQAVGWSDAGFATGIVSKAPASDAPWRSVFWGASPEILTDSVSANIINQSLGWLSDLGDSTLAVDQYSTANNATRMFTLTVRNLPDAPQNMATVTNTLPISLTLDPLTLTGATYDAATRQIRWSGPLASGGEHQIRYQATVTGSAGQQIDNFVEFFYARHQLTFERTTSVWVETPNMTQSVLSAEFTTLGNPITYTFQMTNTDLSGTLNATIFLPAEQGILTSTLSTSSGSAHIDSHQIIWDGPLANAATVTVSLAMTSSLSADNINLYTIARIQDGVSAPIVRELLIHPPAVARNWLPLFFIK